MTCTLCGHIIRSYTGLLELNKLMQHLKNFHKKPVSMQRAMEIRIEMEDGKIPNLE